MIRESFILHYAFFILRFLQAGIDVRRDIPDVVLQRGIAAFQGGLYLADVIQHGGVILTEFLADIRQAQVGQLTHQVHGDLPGFGDALALLAAAKHHLVHRVELADLADDQAGGGQGVALALEHIVNGPGNVGQVQGHLIQVPVCQDLLHGAFDLTDIVGHINGDVVAHIVIQIQTQLLGLVLQNGQAAGSESG